MQNMNAFVMRAVGETGFMFTEVDPDEAIMDLTRGVGVDAAIEAIGSQMALDSCLRMIRPGGVIVNIGIHSNGNAISILTRGRQTG